MSGLSTVRADGTHWRNGHAANYSLAEGVGFEPTEARASMVFKTIPFGRSGIPPGVRLGPACLHTVEAAERDQHLGDRERAAGALVVLE
jgi:hypothetical protein